MLFFAYAGSCAADYTDMYKKKKGRVEASKIDMKVVIAVKRSNLALR